MVAFTVSAPTRLSIAGGGCDLPEHYRHSSARVLAAAIDRRVVVRVATAAEDGAAPHADPRLALFHRMCPDPVRVEVASSAPAGAGLGGSGALTVCLVTALSLLRRGVPGGALESGLLAYHWERDLLGQPVGFQDPVAASIGGAVEMTVTRAGELAVKRRADLTAALDELLGQQIRLFATDRRRAASTRLAGFASQLANRAPEAAVLADAGEIEATLLARDGAAFGELVRRRWESKRRLTPGASWPAADEALRTCLELGAGGGKVVGAGGGGLLMVAGPDKAMSEVVPALAALGMPEMPVRVDRGGVLIDQYDQRGHD